MSGTICQYIYSGVGVEITDDGKVSTTSPTSARTFQARLTGETSISVAGGPPDTFPLGQPTTLLSINVSDFRAGNALIQVSGSFYLIVDDAATEDQPQVQLSLWIDGVEIAESRNTNLFYWAQAFPNALNAMSIPANIIRLVEDIEEGEHTFELKWGVKGGTDNLGSVPATTSAVSTTDGHATLIVQEC